MAQSSVLSTVPNSRIGHLKRFLSAAPQRSSRLRLLTQEETPLPLAEYAVQELRDRGADLAALEIDGVMLDHGANVGRSRVQFVLAWCDESGAQITCKPFTVYSHQLSDGLSPEDAARQLDGSSSSLVAQAQRHTEAMAKVYVSGMAQLLSMQERLVEKMAERLMTVESQGQSTTAQLLEAKETIMGLLSEGTEDGKLTEAQTKALELGERYLPVVWALVQQGHAKRRAARPEQPRTEAQQPAPAVAAEQVSEQAPQPRARRKVA